MILKRVCFWSLLGFGSLLDFNRTIRKLIFFQITSKVSEMHVQADSECLTIGYFGIRAKAQVCRLLCEYLGLPYRDRFFTPDQWEHFQQAEARGWVIRALPFLKDGQFVVTGQQGMIEYIVRKAGQLSLLGATPRDRIALDAFKSKHDIKDNIIALICQMNRSSPKESPLKPPQFYWLSKIYPKLLELQSCCCDKGWFLGYLTVADFSLYEMVNNLLWLFPTITGSFPKLMKLRERLLVLQRISAYESSGRAVKLFNPICFFREFEQRVEKALRWSHPK